jgi:tellurite resistance protein
MMVDFFEIKFLQVVVALCLDIGCAEDHILEVRASCSVMATSHFSFSSSDAHLNFNA